MGLPLISLEIFLGFGVPLAWGFWELLSLRRERRRDAQRQAQQDAAASAAEAAVARAPPPE